ncbi:MAG: hypothetical protein C0397_03275 [Odoribacter sp.]|nr:hypothetical protein [Odoribacter sp.]
MEAEAVKNGDTNLDYVEQTQKAIELIETVYRSIDTNGFEENIHSIDSIISILDRHFSKETERRVSLKLIKNQLLEEKAFNRKGFRYEGCIKSYKLLLQNLILEINIIGLPSKNDIKFDNQIKIENKINLSQQQSTSIELYIGLLKDAFTESQLDALSEIIKGEKNKETFKPKILEKLKEFGSDVSSNILASLISNPEVWSKMFL